MVTFLKWVFGIGGAIFLLCKFIQWQQSFEIEPYEYRWIGDWTSANPKTLGPIAQKMLADGKITNSEKNDFNLAVDNLVKQRDKDYVKSLAQSVNPKPKEEATFSKR